MVKIPKIPQLFLLQKAAMPILVGGAVLAGTIVSLVQIRRQKVWRQRWLLPIIIVSALLFAGLFGAVIEYAVNSQPRVACTQDSYTNDACIESGNRGLSF